MNLNGRPGDERGVIHKRFFGAAKGFVTGGPTGAIGGFFGGGGGGGGISPGEVERRAMQAALAAAGLPPKGGETFGTYILRLPEQLQATARNLLIRLNLIEPTGGSAFSSEIPGDCKPPNELVGDICVPPGSPAGEPGRALMGQFGAALEPTFFTINQRRCIPGMILGKDKLCYNIGAISNKERLWPKGAAPLLTGGEMSAIRKAATAAGKFQRAGKRLAAVGKTFTGPAVRRASTPKRLTAGRTVKVLESGPGSVQL